MSEPVEFGGVPADGRRREKVPPPCPVPSCPRTVWAKGLCLYHYKRQRAGKPIEEPQPGDAAGHGRYGIVDRTEEAALCHECGGWYVSVSNHISPAHGITVQAYRDRYGIPRREPLAGLDLMRRRSEASLARVGGPAWRRLEAARDPEAAHLARTEESFARRGPRVLEVARENGRKYVAKPHPCMSCGTEITGRLRTCSPECARAVRSDNAARQHRSSRVVLSPEEVAELRQAADRADLIEAHQRRGVSSVDLATALGRSASWMACNHPRARVRSSE